MEQTSKKLIIATVVCALVLAVFAAVGCGKKVETTSDDDIAQKGALKVLAVDAAGFPDSVCMYVYVIDEKGTAIEDASVDQFSIIEHDSAGTEYPATITSAERLGSDTLSALGLDAESQGTYCLTYSTSFTDASSSHEGVVECTGSVNNSATFSYEVTAQSGSAQNADELRAALNISEDYRDSFVHGDKGAEYQKYIVLHDTEGDGDASSVIDYWDGNGAGVAAHFIVNRDGSIVQCVPMDKITHHAGYGDTGHNESFGVTDESRDDKVGTVSIGSDFADYGMNSYSIGIEMVHVGGGEDYTEAQLEALDNLIAYIDAYYGFESTITDHKSWRSGNSDTSSEFAGYLANYIDHRTHN